MKIKNIFKKSTKKVVKANVETLAKNQLEKVIGGADTKKTNTKPNTGTLSGHGGGAASASYA
jgi:hypothetical protein